MIRTWHSENGFGASIPGAGVWLGGYESLESLNEQISAVRTVLPDCNLPREPHSYNPRKADFEAARKAALRRAA